MKHATIAAILLVFGCNTQSPNQQQAAEPPQSRPLSSSSGGGEQVEVTVYPDGRDPISRARLREIWPPLNTLSEDAVRRVAEAVNLIPSPCADCGSIPVAHCFEKGSAEACPVLNKLFERATRLANAGETQKVVKESINYPDVWFDGMGEGTPPKITLYRDESGPFSVKATEAVEDIRTHFGDKVTLEIFGADVAAPDKLEVRSRPTWFINGHRFRGAQSTTILKRFIEFELADEQK